MKLRCAYPTPGPGHWDYKCLRCDQPIDEHKLRYRLVFPTILAIWVLGSLIAITWLFLSASATSVLP